MFSTPMVIGDRLEMSWLPKWEKGILYKTKSYWTNHILLFHVWLFILELSLLIIANDSKSKLLASFYINNCLYFKILFSEFFVIFVKKYKYFTCWNSLCLILWYYFLHFFVFFFNNTKPTEAYSWCCAFTSKFQMNRDLKCCLGNILFPISAENC